MTTRLRAARYGRSCTQSLTELRVNNCSQGSALEGNQCRQACLSQPKPAKPSPIESARTTTESANREIAFSTVSPLFLAQIRHSTSPYSVSPVCILRYESQAGFCGRDAPRLDRRSYSGPVCWKRGSSCPTIRCHEFVAHLPFPEWRIVAIDL